MRSRIVLGSAFALSMGIAFAYPGGPVRGQDIVTIRNVSSLLFGILSGFFVAFLLNRFATIRSLLTRESTMLMEIFKLAGAFNPDFAQRTADRIDTYLIVRFDEDNYFRFTSRGRDALFVMFEELAALDVQTQNLVTMHRHFASSLREAISLRRETIVTGTITVSRLQWCPLLLLAVILLSALFCLKSDTTVSSLLTGMLTFAICLMLYVIKDLSDLNLGGDFLKYETIERVFEFIGRPRYYPITQVPAGLAEQGVERLRLGIGKNRHYSAEIIEVSVDQAYRLALLGGVDKFPAATVAQ